MSAEGSPTPDTVPASPSPRRPRARRGEGEALREEILAATETLLLERGDEDAVSIREVARRVGRTSPSVYLHFADKQTLLHSVCGRMFGRMAEVMAAAQADSDDPVERIRRCGHAYVAFAVDQPLAYRILLMEPHDWPEPSSFEDLEGDVAFQALHDNVVAAFEAGRFRGPDPGLVSVILWMSVHGLASLLVARPTFAWPPTGVLVDQLFDQHLVGLLVDAR